MQISQPKFVVDFEQEVHKAISFVFPTAVIRGCNFHLGQDWKIQELELSVLYKKAEEELENSEFIVIDNPK